jgi:hypothetical protein
LDQGGIQVQEELASWTRKEFKYKKCWLVGPRKNSSTRRAVQFNQEGIKYKKSWLVGPGRNSSTRRANQLDQEGIKYKKSWPGGPGRNSSTKRVVPKRSPEQVQSFE